MDVAYPYADGAARLALLYRVPSPPPRRRLLLVTDDPSMARIGQDWGGEVTTIAPSELKAESERGTDQFDVVAVPDLFDLRTAGSRGPDVDQRLGWVYRLLVPGGLVVGHFEYGLSLRRLTAAGALVRLVRSTSRLGIVASVPYCKRALRRAGFIDLTCYYVHPHIDSPMGLIPSERRAARAHFVRMTRAQRGGHGLLMQGLRLGLAQVGLGGTMQPQLFVWASKPC